MSFRFLHTADWQIGKPFGSIPGDAGAEGQLEQLGRQLEGRRLEARAARLLHETLLDLQRESRERWLAPISKKAARYLRLLRRIAGSSSTRTPRS